MVTEFQLVRKLFLTIKTENVIMVGDFKVCYVICSLCLKSSQVPLFCIVYTLANLSTS